MTAMLNPYLQRLWNKSISGQTDLDNATKATIEEATTNGKWESIVYIGVSIDRWRFKPNWNASLFNKICEDQSVTIPSSPATLPSNTKDNILPSSVRAPTPTDLPSTICMLLEYKIKPQLPSTVCSLQAYTSLLCLYFLTRVCMNFLLRASPNDIVTSMNWFYDTSD
eukprot:jgi/Psemu1/58527/gm1.58527_g